MRRLPWVGKGWGTLGSSVPGVPAGGQAGKAAGHSFATLVQARVSMMGCAVLRSAESIRGRDHAGTSDTAVPGSGGHDLHDYASTSL
jgi:hypothetical protein